MEKQSKIEYQVKKHGTQEEMMDKMEVKNWREAEHGGISLCFQYSGRLRHKT